MKIEIDIDDVLRGDCDEPSESVEDAIRRQIIDRLSADLRKRLFDRLDQQLMAVLQTELSNVVATKMPELIDDIMNSKYTPVSSYGSRGEPTTFRDEIIKAVVANMKYEPKRYESEENTFTKAVKSIVDAKTAAIKSELIARVDKKFAEDALAFAAARLSECLGLAKGTR